MGQHGNSGSLQISNLGNIEIIGFVCCCSGISLREKKSQSPEKKEATENREDKHSKNQQKSKSPQISQGSVWRVLPSNLVRLLQATHAVPPGQGKGAFYSPLPADPAARARAQSRVMSPGLLMLPRQAPCCTPTSAFPASCRRASELHFFRRWTLFDGF